MKKLITKISLIIITIFALSTTVFAGSVEETLNKVIPKPGTSDKFKEIDNVAGLPEVTLESAISVTIETILAWAMLLTLVAIVVAGIYFIQSRGTEEDITKAKDIILYLVIGMAIMAASYGVIAGLSQFKFF
jgi:hypothetical protein